MIDLILISLVVVTLIILFLFWYAKYTAKSGFSIDENQERHPGFLGEKIRDSYLS